jgi:hypothetical protein
MLFDLRSRRRRTMVKVVYGGLALLIGLGLIGFGIGTGFNFGGLFTAAANGGGGTAAGNSIATKAMVRAERSAAADPSSPAAWAAAGKAAYAVATLPTNYVPGKGYTKTGFPVLAKVKTAWNRYVALAPANPDNTFANEVVVAFGSAPAGIQDWATAESAQEIVTQISPTYGEYEYLAYFAYLAKEISRGDLAAARAIAVAPKGLRKQVATSMRNIRNSALGVTGASGTTATTTTTTS